MTQNSPHLKRWLVLPLLCMGALLVAWGAEQLIRSSVYGAIEQFTFAIGDGYERWFAQQSTGNPLVLTGLAFLGGLIASISPCILSLLPVNLSYIGTRNITSRRDALMKASAFVLGVVTILSVLGLFSSLAGILLVQYRGYVQVVVGIVIVLMGLSLAGMISIALPQNSCVPTLLDPPRDRVAPPSLSRSWTTTLRTSTRAILTGPYGVGLTFALVSSPCTSPVMFSVLAAAAATGSQLQSTITMISYALGYTAIIFLASLFAGLAKQTRVLLIHSRAIARIASILLLLMGTFYLITGGQWIASIWLAK